MNVIVVCDCKGMPPFAENAYSLLFPDEPRPVVLTAERAHDLYPSNEYFAALAKSEQKFALAFKGDEIWDLKKGEQIA